MNSRARNITSKRRILHPDLQPEPSSTALQFQRLLRLRPPRSSLDFVAVVPAYLDRHDRAITNLDLFRCFSFVPLCGTRLQEPRTQRPAPSHN
ncbi:hypothetical protein BRADI_3g44262v3 [Brachypodium distachyon]|uniref:Uncharacterized protein n=1 Tax=Brachypodium distachyon TaxID=15368 RepID=A0A2K2D327_BRADI|nr:hypothetical protein BRADI_3g44262v3 [Brachypodium distachyon]PNT68687.1 hypothetical protein BRADI_3g44262v3 [Brachypodium distachyon]PNT68688.1 hypothetical protein BRADI_3g44262v3 [Brachypodium distachyon]PNT68689.1 hypothetical protein BRADI_3g44262v3 [Brachypodium distachyon]